MKNKKKLTPQQKVNVLNYALSGKASNLEFSMKHPFFKAMGQWVDEIEEDIKNNKKQDS